MDRPLKIGLFSPYDHAFHGGVRNHIIQIADQFRSWDHEVRIVAPCSAPDSIGDPDFIPMGRPVPLPTAGSVARVSLSVWITPNIKSVLESEGFDVVHIHEPCAGMVPLGTLSSLKRRSAVNVATFHSYRGRRTWWAIGSDRLVEPLINRLHGRIAVSEPAMQFISKHFPGSYTVIPNGIEVDEFALAEPLPELMDGKMNLLFLGRLEKRKGLKYLLLAYSRLKWDFPDLRLIVVGPGEPDADCYRIMSERNLQDVIFTGRVSDQARARYFKSAHVYCSPAVDKESFGIVLLEAMAAGAPVVATDIVGYASVVEHGRDGMLVPPKDDEALADTIQSLLRDPALRSRLSKQGARTADSFRWERVAGRVLDYYQDLVPAPYASAKLSASC